MSKDDATTAFEELRAIVDEDWRDKAELLKFKHEGPPLNIFIASDPWKSGVAYRQREEQRFEAVCRFTIQHLERYQSDPNQGSEPLQMKRRKIQVDVTVTRRDEECKT